MRASSLKQLDERVARRAFDAGVSGREIGLMLVAGSRYVQQLDARQGKAEARAYVNRVVGEGKREKRKIKNEKRRGKSISLGD